MMQIYDYIVVFRNIAGFSSQLHSPSTVKFVFFVCESNVKHKQFMVRFLLDIAVPFVLITMHIFAPRSVIQVELGNDILVLVL